MKKISIFSVAALTAILMFTQIPSAEARGHTRVQVGMGVGSVYSTRTVVRQYSRPVALAPVFTHPPSYYYCPQRGCYMQVPVMQAPVYVPAPVYVEEVYAAPSPIGLGGLSFSWSWFK